MKNFIQDGNTISLTAPYDVTSGKGFLVGQVFAVATCDALSGAAVEGCREGVFDLVKVSAQGWSIGDAIYWDDSAKKCDNVGGAAKVRIGIATAVAANPTSTGRVLLELPPNKAATVAALTIGTLSGTANGAMESIGATNSGDVSGAISNNFKECFTQINAIILALQNAGYML